MSIFSDQMLPESAKLLISIIGKDAAISLIKNCGGMTIYISKKSNLKLGLEDRLFYMFFDYFNGSYYCVPNCYQAILQERNQKIKEDKLSGIEVNDLSRKYRLTGRTIIKICGSDSTNKHQYDLFRNDSPAI